MLCRVVGIVEGVGVGFRTPLGTIVIAWVLGNFPAILLATELFSNLNHGCAKGGLLLGA